MRKIFIIVNPKSGSHRGHSILKQTTRLFESADINYEVAISNHKNHPYELINKADLSNIDSIAVIGGDGTMHEVVNGMLKRKDKILRPIGLITAGTGNSLMHDLNCLDHNVAAKKIISGQTRKIDIITIRANQTLYYAFNIVGWGIPVDINQVSERMRFIGGQRYNIASLLEIFRNRARAVRITIDDEIIEGKISFFLACNTVYTGNGMKMSPASILDDGFLNLFYVKKARRLKLLSLLMKVFSGKHLGDPILKSSLAKSFSIHSTEIHELNIDGQLGYFTPITAELTGLQIEIFS